MLEAQFLGTAQVILLCRHNVYALIWTEPFICTRICIECEVFLAGKSPNLRPYGVSVHKCGKHYINVLAYAQRMSECLLHQAGLLPPASSKTTKLYAQCCTLTQPPLLLTFFAFQNPCVLCHVPANAKHRHGHTRVGVQTAFILLQLSTIMLGPVQLLTNSINSTIAH